MSEKHYKVFPVVFPFGYASNNLPNSTFDIPGTDPPNKALASPPPLQVVSFSIPNHPLEKNEGLPSSYRFGTFTAYKPGGELLPHSLYLLINPI